MSDVNIPRMKVRSAGPASYCSTHIETFFKDGTGEFIPVGNGTGFFVRLADQVLLVTTWHVLTGRHPENPSKTLDGYQTSPTHLRLCIPKRSEPKFFQYGEYFPLYDDHGSPVWLESSQGYDLIDIALIAIRLPDDAYFYAIDDFAPYQDTALEPGREVAIVGFPFGRNETNPFPVWKRAMIASEPSSTISGRPYTYLDSPGRPGMSGSPVYFLGNGFGVTRAEGEILRSGDIEKGVEILRGIDPKRMLDNRIVLEFAGLYSGSYGDGHLDRLNLGRFWPAPLMYSLILSPRKGQNPYR